MVFQLDGVVESFFDLEACSGPTATEIASNNGCSANGCFDPGDAGCFRYPGDLRVWSCCFEAAPTGGSSWLSSSAVVRPYPLCP